MNHGLTMVIILWLNHGMVVEPRSSHGLFTMVQPRSCHGTIVGFSLLVVWRQRANKLRNAVVTPHPAPRVLHVGYRPVSGQPSTISCSAITSWSLDSPSPSGHYHSTHSICNHGQQTNYSDRIPSAANS